MIQSCSLSSFLTRCSKVRNQTKHSTVCSQSSLGVTTRCMPYTISPLVVYAGVGRCWKVMDRTRHTSICDRSYLDAVLSKQITHAYGSAICGTHVAKPTYCELTICGAQVCLRAVPSVYYCHCATITSRTHLSATCGKQNCVVCGWRKPQFLRTHNLRKT